MRDTNPSTDSCDDTTNNDWDFSRLPADETIAHDEFVLPPELLEERRWLVYRIQKRHGKYTKVPYAPFFSPSGNLKYSGTASPENWTGFSSASAFVELTEHELGPQAVNGTGFVFTDSDDIMGVDLDHCVNQETGEIERWALEIVRELDSYTEFTQSRCRSTTSRNTNKPERVTVEPTDVIVIEGSLALYDDELNDMSTSTFTSRPTPTSASSDAPSATSSTATATSRASSEPPVLMGCHQKRTSFWRASETRRRLAHCTRVRSRERHRPVLTQVKPMHEQFVEPTKKTPISSSPRARTPSPSPSSKRKSPPKRARFQNGVAGKPDDSVDSNHLEES